MINRKILLCFNKYKEKDEIENYFENSFFSKDRIGAIDFVYDWPSFEEKRGAIKSNEYTALVVLCQLTWQDGQGKLHEAKEHWGVRLVQREICLDKEIDIPVLFLSFLPKKDIIDSYPDMQIISLYTLGYHFIQLSTTGPSNADLEAFYKMERVLPLEKEDAYQFANPKGMLALIRHDVKQDKVEYYRKWLEQILQTAAESTEKKQLLELLDSATEEDIRNICTEAEKLFTDAILSLPKENTATDKQKPHVLILEDDENILREFKVEAKDKIILTHHTNTVEALAEIKADTNNTYKVVIVDFRIWDNPSAALSQRTMTQPQGYRFIEKVVAMGHYCIFIALSELPRMFQHRISSLSSILIVPENKQLVLSTPQQRANFIQKLCYWAADTEERLKVNAFGSEKLFEFYKWLLMQKEELKKIDTKAIELIESFKSEVNNNKSNIFIKEFKETKELLESKSYKSEWKIEEKELSNKEYVEKWVEKIFEDYWIKKEWTSLLKADIRDMLEVNKKSDDIIKEYFGEFKNIKGKSDFNKHKEKIRKSLEGVISIEKLKNKRKELNYNKDRETFVNKIIIRRFAIYLYYWIEKEFSEENLIKNHKIAAVNYFLIKYKFDENETYKKPDNRITSKCLRLTPNTSRRTINSLQDIALTFEEVIFFRNNVPNLYNEIK
jgi:hypothetical protein